MQPASRCNARPVATGLVICVCDWLRDETGLDFGDRSWICNATLLMTLKIIQGHHCCCHLISHVRFPISFAPFSRYQHLFAKTKRHHVTLTSPTWGTVCPYKTNTSRTCNAREREREGLFSTIQQNI